MDAVVIKHVHQKLVWDYQQGQLAGIATISNGVQVFLDTKKPTKSVIFFRVSFGRRRTTSSSRLANSSRLNLMFGGRSAA
jgi:hypothetical protein